MELWDRSLTVFKILGNCQTIFQSSHAMHIPINSVWEFQYLYISANTYDFPFLIIAILVGIKWYLMVASSIFKSLLKLWTLTGYLLTVVIIVNAQSIGDEGECRRSKADTSWLLWKLGNRHVDTHTMFSAFLRMFENFLFKKVFCKFTVMSC